MTKFEDHLWREFVREHGNDLAQLNRPTTGHTLRRPRLVAGAGLSLAGGATALALVLTVTSAPPAFAVTRNQNGSVTVTIRSAAGIAGANAKLGQLGIRAQVAATAPAGCQLAHAAAEQAASQQTAARSVATPSGTGNAIAQWTVNPTAIAASQTVVLTPPAGNSGTSSAGNSGTSGNSGSGGVTPPPAGNSGMSPAGNSGTGGNSGSGGVGQTWTCWSPAGAVARSGNPAGNS